MGKSVYTSGSDKVSKSSTRILRHDLTDVPRHLEHALYKFDMAQRELFVYLVFMKRQPVDVAFDVCYYSFEDVCDKIRWLNVDRFALDNSKTYINGRFYV